MALEFLKASQVILMWGPGKSHFYRARCPPWDSWANCTDITWEFTSRETQASLRASWIRISVSKLFMGLTDALKFEKPCYSWWCPKSCSKSCLYSGSQVQLWLCSVILLVGSPQTSAPLPKFPQRGPWISVVIIDVIENHLRILS